MYCPHCGAQSTVGLRYCKRCGANLAPQPGEVVQPLPPKIGGAFWPLALATVAITLGGLGIVLSSAYELVRPIFGNETPHINPTPVALAIIICGTATVFGVVAMLIKLFMRIAGVVQPADQSSHSSKVITNELPNAQLPSPPASVSSVTEHTTRNFDSIYREPREKEEWNRR